MTTMAQSMQQVLDLAPDFSIRTTPVMRARDAATEALRSDLVESLAAAADIPAAAALGLMVETGGRQGSYGPVAWVRIFSPEFSRSARAGRYLVYLFAADGSRAYLSLSQGTSDPLRAGLRPMNDPPLLRSWASQARAELGDLIEDPAVIGASIRLDLGLAGAPVSAYSKSRSRNYEYANILARGYRSGSIPGDKQLRADLYGMLPLLARLYGQVAAVPARRAAATGGPNTEEPAQGAESPAQRYQMDSAVRRAVEIFAEDRAVEHFKRLGWSVNRVGSLHYGYDLDCRRGTDEVLHVEVKGTQGHGEEVFLTRNEVRHNMESAECGAAHALYVVSGIGAQRTDPIRCTGGTARCFLPWNIDPSALSEIQYAYRVPGGPDRPL